MLMMIQRTNEPENERKRRQVGVHVEKGDDVWWQMNAIRLNIKQGGSSLPN